MHDMRRRSLQQREVEREQGGDLEELLLQELNAGSKYRDIARRWGVSEMSIYRWIDDFNLRRTITWDKPEMVEA